MIKLKNIIIVISLFLVTFIIFELFCNLWYFNNIGKFDSENSKQYRLMPYKKALAFNPDLEFYYGDETIYNEIKTAKKPAAIVGCSCTEGIGLKREETFAFNLNKITGRKIYSRARAGRGLPYVYYQIAHKLIPDDIEYIVYVYLPNHLYNMSKYQTPDCFENNMICLRYGIQDDKIVQLTTNSVNPFYSLYSVKYIQTIIEKKLYNSELISFKMFSHLLLDTVDMMHKNYPDAKFIILKFQVDELQNTYLPKFLEEALIKKGCVIIDAEKLTGEKYYLLKNKLQYEKIHPNAMVWKILTPKFVQAANL